MLLTRVIPNKRHISKDMKKLKLGTCSLPLSAVHEIGTEASSGGSGDPNQSASTRVQRKASSILYFHNFVLVKKGVLRTQIRSSKFVFCTSVHYIFIHLFINLLIYSLLRLPLLHLSLLKISLLHLSLLKYLHFLTFL